MLVVEGGAVSAAAVGWARKRPRRSRVRREPIDLDRITAEFAEPRPRPEQEILAALEAEVRRAKQHTDPVEALLVDAVQLDTQVDTPVDAVPPVEPAILIPLGPVLPDSDPAPDTRPVAEPDAPDAATSAPPVGLPLDQLREWLDQVHADLEKVQLRLEFLRAEQHRLQGQHRLVEDLITTSETV